MGHVSHHDLGKFLITIKFTSIIKHIIIPYSSFTLFFVCSSGSRLHPKILSDLFCDNITVKPTADAFNRSHIRPSKGKQ